MKTLLMKPLSAALVALCASMGVSAQTAGSASSPAMQTPAAGSGTISGNAGASGVTSNEKKAAVNASDRAFMMKAAGSGMYEVEVSKLAEQKASDAGVKEMASMMVKDHTAANAELMQLAGAKGITLPAKLPADKQAIIKKLSGRSGAAFDRDYMRIVGISDHQKDVKLFESNSRSTKDPELKAFIDKTLPTLRQHLTHAQGVKVAGTGMTRNGGAGMAGSAMGSGNASGGMSDSGARGKP